MFNLLPLLVIILATPALARGSVATPANEGPSSTLNDAPAIELKPPKIKIQVPTHCFEDGYWEDREGYRHSLTYNRCTGSVWW
jgi:hypothetical protein